MRVRLLTPAAGLWCSQRYRALRERGFRPGAAALTLGWLLAWALFPSSVMAGNGCWAMPGGSIPS
jgi:cellulose synthase (UDP-forming)